MTEDRLFMCHEDVQTNAIRTLGSLSIALLKAVFVDTENDTCSVLVSSTDAFVLSEIYIPHFNELNFVNVILHELHRSDDDTMVGT